MKSTYQATATEKDVTTVLSEENAGKNEQAMPLTPEQRGFAEVVGREIARLWAEMQQDAESGCQTR